MDGELSPERVPDDAILAFVPSGRGQTVESTADAGKTDEEKTGDEFVVEIPRMA